MTARRGEDGENRRVPWGKGMKCAPFTKPNEQREQKHPNANTDEVHRESQTYSHDRASSRMKTGSIERLFFVLFWFPLILDVLLSFIQSRGESEPSGSEEATLQCGIAQRFL